MMIVIGYDRVIQFVVWYGSNWLHSEPQDAKMKISLFQDVLHLLEIFYHLLQYQIMQNYDTVKQVIH